MSTTACICSSLDTGFADLQEGIRLHHAFCPQWTMLYNHVYPSHDDDEDPSYYIPRYVFTNYPKPNMYYCLRHTTEEYLLSIPALLPLSALVQRDLTDEYTPFSEYLAYRTTDPHHQDIIRTFAPDDEPLDLSDFSGKAVQMFIMFVHGNSRLEKKKEWLRKKHWMELVALAQIFDMQSLFVFALEGLKKCKDHRKRSSSSSSKKGSRRRSSGFAQAKRFLRRLVSRISRDPGEFSEEEFSGLSEFHAWE